MKKTALSTTYKQGELLIVKTKERTFHAKVVKEFSPFHSMIYPVRDMDQGGKLVALSFQDVKTLERDLTTEAD